MSAPLATVTVTVLSPVLRLTWWPAAWPSASAGATVTVAPGNKAAAVTVVDVVVLGTRAAYRRRPTGSTMSTPENSSDFSEALGGML